MLFKDLQDIYDPTSSLSESLTQKVYLGKVIGELLTNRGSLIDF